MKTARLFSYTLRTLTAVLSITLFTTAQASAVVLSPQNLPTSVAQAAMDEKITEDSTTNGTESTTAESTTAEGVEENTTDETTLDEVSESEEGEAYEVEIQELADDLFPEVKVTTSSNVRRYGSRFGITMLADESVVIDEVVSADLFTAGNTVSINEAVEGDVFAAANSIRVDDHVVGSLRMGGNSITINGSVGGNALLFANTVHITKDAVIHGHANIYADTIIIDGTIKRTLSIGGNTVILNGTTKDAVEVNSASITIGSQAVLENETTIPKNGTLKINEGAEGTDYISYSERSVNKKNGFTDSQKHKQKLHSWLKWYFFMTIIGIIVILIWPTSIRNLTKVVEKHPMQTWQRGLLFFFIVPAIALCLLFTIIGIPISLLLMLFYTILLGLGRLFAGLLIGKHIVNEKRLKDDKKQLILEFLVGSFVLSVITSIPWVGWLFCIVASVWGAGGILLAIKMEKKKKRENKK